MDISNSLLIFSAVSLSLGAPIGTEYIAWKQMPNSRGTWSIITSCITTLALCVYTAVHINVPVLDETNRKRKLCLARWVLAAIFAPEVVVWVAWSQWSEARSLSKELEKILDRFDDSTNPVVSKASDTIELQSLRNLRSSWTLQHSFFVVSGGYQFRPTDIVEPSLPGAKFTHVPRVMDPRAFLALIKLGYTDNIVVPSSADLADRSKADKVAKLLSCAQGMWFVTQLVGRLVDGLIITELEVNTLAHCVCAVLMYGFWFYKPLNVEQPILVNLDGFRWDAQVGIRSKLCKELVRFWHKSTEDSADKANPRTHIHQEIDSIQSCDQCLQNCRLTRRKSALGLILQPEVTTTVDLVHSILQQHPKRTHFIDFVTKQPSSVSRVDELSVQNADNGNENTIHSDDNEASMIVDQKALDAILRLWWLVGPQESMDAIDDSLRYDVHKASHMVSTRATSVAPRVIIMMIVSSCYGSIHASLWNQHFPTTAELWMWRVSSLVVASNGLFIAIAAALTLVHYPLGPKDGKVGLLTSAVNALVKKLGQLTMSFFKLGYGNIVQRTIKHSTFYTIGLVQLVFLLSRLYLFIEAFVSLRSQPPSAYVVPQWSQWMPHF